MKNNQILSVLLGMLLLGIFANPVIAGEGPELEACSVESLPEPTAGKFLRGDFTVARDQGAYADDDSFPNGEHYNIHIRLQRAGQLHIFATLAEVEFGDLSVLTVEDLLGDTFGWISRPCLLQVNLPFGLDGIPVIYSLSIEQVENGGAFNETMYGTVAIRVVPVPF